VTVIERLCLHYPKPRLDTTHKVGYYPQGWILPTRLDTTHKVGYYPQGWILPTRDSAARKAIDACSDQRDKSYPQQRLARPTRSVRRPCIGSPASLVTRRYVALDDGPNARLWRCNFGFIGFLGILGQGDIRELMLDALGIDAAGLRACFEGRNVGKKPEVPWTIVLQCGYWGR
jgi:hypothetical protein